ncbi:MAG: hypothetical protein ABSF44_15830 [Candidatus Bathyarchaeia archaeon]|jgi:hypothetical protein
MSHYLLEPEECNGFFEPKPLPDTIGIKDIVDRRFTSQFSIPNPLVVAYSPSTKSPSASERIFNENKEVFIKLKDGLVQKPEFENKFIAIKDGKMVDSDYDRSILVERLYTKYGYVPLFIGKVVKQEKYKELPSPEKAKA